MKLNKLVSAAVVAGALTFAGAASAGVITLSPTNTNPGCTNLTAAACGAVGTAANFATDNAITRYVGVIDIAAAAGATTYAESGSLRVESFSLAGNQINGTGVNKGGGGNYDIYAIYTIAGAGAWAVPGVIFNATSFTTFSVSLYAAPSSGGAPTIATPTSGSDATGGITHGAGAFLLGTSTIINQPSNFAFAALNPGGTASTALSVLIDFTAAAGTAGATGFFFAPDPFIITIGAAAGGQSNNTNWVNNGAGIRITTAASNPGGGSLAFGVPEPGMLTLLGISLVGLAAVGRRRMKVQR